jgi:Fur family zinc uptake transcriptional regulator
MPHPVFPALDHDHDRCSAEAMAYAEALCSARAQRLTRMRRRVLEALLASHRPLGAYEIMDRTMTDGARPAPITIYRALDFLIEQGLVHRLESRNSFMACVHKHGQGDLVVFLICERCGRVGEAPAKGVGQALQAAARAADFTPHAPVIEISGVCGDCRKNAPADG